MGLSDSADLWRLIREPLIREPLIQALFIRGLLIQGPLIHVNPGMARVEQI